MISIEKCTANWNKVTGAKVKTPDGVGGQWKGIPHADLIRVLNGPESKTCTDGYFHAAMSTDQQEIAASWRLTRQQGIKILTINQCKLIPAIGIVSSNNRTKRLQVYCGYIGSDGCHVVGHGYSGPKFNQSFDLVSFGEETLNRWQKEMSLLESTILKIPQKEICRSESYDIMIELARKSIISWRQLGRLVGGWCNESTNQTWWNLFRLTSIALNTTQPFDQMLRRCKFYQVFNNKIQQEKKGNKSK